MTLNQAYRYLEFLVCGSFMQHSRHFIGYSRYEYPSSGIGRSTVEDAMPSI